MAPWAKLNTPEALKMSTNPKATSEYITPVRIPLMTTSAKKIGEPAISTNGATNTAIKTSIVSMLSRAAAAGGHSCGTPR